MPPDDSDLIAILARSFPALAGLDQAEAQRKVETLGLQAATLWAAGRDALAARGLNVPADVWESVAGEASRVTQARRGGAQFLSRLRASLRSDGRFVPVVLALAQTVARSTSGTFPAVTSTQLEPPLAIGQTTSRYRREIAGFEVVSQLGQGAMGAVFKARQKSLDRFVALKILPRELAQDQDYLVRFHREAKSAAALSHPNIVGVIDQGTDAASGVHYIAFEFVDGTTFEEMIRARGKVPEREALQVIRSVALALACAERAGIVHRDVKPSNILIGRDGTAKLADLGLARKQDTALQSSLGYMVGTPAFMAPERAIGKPSDHRADHYSLGLTLYRALTGKHAFEGTATTILMAHLEQDCPDPRALEPSVSEATAKIVAKLAARDPAARYATGQSIADDIDLVLGARPATPIAASSGMIPADPTWSLELTPAAIADASLAPPEPSDPAEALLAALERSGDPEELGQAIDRFEAALREGQSSDPIASARTEVALARAYLLRGDRSNAEGRARRALDKDPRCRAALELLVRTARGDAQRCRLETGLARVRSSIAKSRLDLAKKLAERVREEFPQEPHAFLALAAVARLTGSEADLVDSVRRAWALFPSKELGDVGLGGLDGLVADVLVGHGRSAYRGDGSLLKATMEGLDDRSNLVAGALRMAIAVARVALERGGLTLFEQRRLHTAVARALSSLRRYDAAADEIARASQFKPSEREVELLDAEKAFVVYMRNMLEASGQKRADPEIACLGAGALVALHRARLDVAEKERASAQYEMEKVGASVVSLAAREPSVRAEIREAAARLGQKDPFAEIEPIETELAEIARERAAAKEEAPEPKVEPEPKKTGFFGKLKSVAGAAAAGVAGAAKGAQLLLRERQARSRLDGAVKTFAVVYGRDLAQPSAVHPELRPLAKRAAGLSMAAELHGELATRAGKDVERLSPLA